VASETDENGHQTTHTYTALGLPAGDTPPAPLGPTNYTFNSYDQEATVTDGKGQLTTFMYDGEGRARSVAFADGGSLGYSYDAAGNVLAMTDATGTATYTYNTLNQLTKKTLPNGQTVSYTYDNAGNLLTKTDSGGTVTYTYQNDPRNLVSSVTDRSNNKTTLGYDALGNMTSMAFPNGITQNTAYNSAGQLTSIYAQNANLHKFTSFGYSYTNPNTNQATGLPYSVTDTSGNVTTNTYDGVNQLTQAIQKTSGGSTLHSYSFGFDPAGNMTSKAVDGTSTTFTYNAANELAQASGGINKTYSYDGNGDLTSISDGTQLALNAAGQITSITPPGGGPVNMTYTGVGETQRVGAGTKNYQYDAAGLSNQTDGSNSTYFTSLPDGTVISESVSGSTYYYLSDGAGSVAGLMDSTGALKNQYSYDPLGNITSSSGTVSNPFTFQGGIFDSSTGFYNTGSGYYDPATGRAFGCHDKGWWDPGEDLCGEDEGVFGQSAQDPSNTCLVVTNGYGTAYAHVVYANFILECSMPTTVTFVRVTLQKEHRPRGARRPSYSLVSEHPTSIGLTYSHGEQGFYKDVYVVIFDRPRSSSIIGNYIICFTFRFNDPEMSGNKEQCTGRIRVR
jgi:YD repeat-containing protein